MIEVMEPEPSSDEQAQYDVFRRDSTIDLDVSTEVLPQTGPEQPIKNNKNRRPFKLKKRYFIIALVVALLLTGMVIGVYRLLDKPTQQPSTTVVINTQSLDNGTLNQLTPTTGSEVKQQLTISPKTIFKNDVIVQGSAEIAKSLSVGGPVNIQGAANISNNLSVGGNLTVNGLITAASLNVGSLAISSINLSSNLVFGGHIVPFGTEPTVRISVAAGNGNVSVSGNDTSGTITIITGNGGLLAGELAIVTFRTAFSTTPKVQLTPLNAAASGMNYYATHTAGFFTINTSTVPTINTTYIFDYLVTQ